VVIIAEEEEAPEAEEAPEVAEPEVIGEKKEPVPETEGEQLPEASG